MAALTPVLKKSIVILGDGRIAHATKHFFKLQKNVGSVILSPKGLDKEIKNCDLLVGALPGELGPRCLELALRYQKNLIDVSDVDPPFYLRKIKEIEKKNITVIPGCGFSPGLVNCILGRETANTSGLKSIEVKAGSLSPKKSYYPFLWCFEDLILEHRISSWQMLGNKKIKFPPFAAFENECFFGIEAESYYCASGFENIIEKAKVKSLTCRVVRPKGFEVFFNFLKNEGFLNKENFYLTKKIVESQKEDNYTLAQISFISQEKAVWLIKSFSRKTEALNSMQKITASVPVIVGEMLLTGKIETKGLKFMEDLGVDRKFFSLLLQGLKDYGIIIKRSHD